MAFYDTIRNYLLDRFGKSDAPASVLLPTGQEDYPTFLQNEGMGGTHGFDTIADMLDMKRGRMYVPMLGIVKNDDVYVLKQLPPDGVEKLSDMEVVVISDYWTPLRLNITHPAPEEEPEDGEDGLNGWTGIPSLVSDGPRLVLAFLDYTGGTGSKPNPGYVGPNGIVGDIKQAVDLIAKFNSSSTFTAIVATAGRPAEVEGLQVYPRVVGSSNVVTNNSSIVRNVSLLGQAMARPDSGVEDIVKISIWYSDTGNPGREAWTQLPKSVVQSRINNQVQMNVPGWDQLNPGQKRYYRTEIETTSGGFSLYSPNPSTFIAVF